MILLLHHSADVCKSSRNKSEQKPICGHPKSWFSLRLRCIHRWVLSPNSHPLPQSCRSRPILAQLGTQTVGVEESAIVVSWVFFVYLQILFYDSFRFLKASLYSLIRPRSVILDLWSRFLRLAIWGRSETSAAIPTKNIDEKVRLWPINSNNCEHFKRNSQYFDEMLRCERERAAQERAKLVDLDKKTWKPCKFNSTKKI